MEKSTNFSLPSLKGSVGVVIRLSIIIFTWWLLIISLGKLIYLSTVIKLGLVIMLICAMFINDYNGKENHYKTFNLEFDSLNQLGGKGFEYFICSLYRTLGYEARVTHSQGWQQGDYGADVLLKKYGEKIAIQCKLYKDHEVGIEAVQEIIGGMAYYNVKRGRVITNATFTAQAQLLAKENQIDMIDGEGLKQLMQEASNTLCSYLTASPYRIFCHPFRGTKQYLRETNSHFMKTNKLVKWAEDQLEEAQVTYYKAQDEKCFGAHLVMVDNEKSFSILVRGKDKRFIGVHDVYENLASLKYFGVKEGLILSHLPSTKAAKILCKKCPVSIVKSSTFNKIVHNKK